MKVVKNVAITKTNVGDLNGELKRLKYTVIQIESESRQTLRIGDVVAIGPLRFRLLERRFEIINNEIRLNYYFELK